MSSIATTIIIPPGNLPNINTLAGFVLDRLEEARSTPQFWIMQEIYILLVEAMNEATLITGEPQIKFTQDIVQKEIITLPEGTNLVNLNSLIPVFGMIRLEAGGSVIKKSTMWDMDRLLPGWENDTGNLPDYWFPVGLTSFGIHPQLEAEVTAVISGVVMPVPVARPYTGAETVDFQAEYFDAFVDYASHVAGLKEGTKEFTDSINVYDRFLSKMEELSKFGLRKGTLRFSKTMGFPSSVTPVQQR